MTPRSGLRQIKLFTIGGLPFLGLLAGCHAGQRGVEWTEIQGSLQPLREGFNSDRDRPRLVAIFSPL